MERQTEGSGPAAPDESAAERTREALHDLKDNLAGRAEDLRTRHKDQSLEWQ